MRKSAKPKKGSGAAAQRPASNDARPDTVLVLIDLQGGTMRRYLGRKIAGRHYVIGPHFIADLGLLGVRRSIEDFRRTGA